MIRFFFQVHACHQILSAYTKGVNGGMRIAEYFFDASGVNAYPAKYVGLCGPAPPAAIATVGTVYQGY
jgi:hypothetical protein